MLTTTNSEAKKRKLYESEERGASAAAYGTADRAGVPTSEAEDPDWLVYEEEDEEEEDVPEDADVDVDEEEVPAGRCRQLHAMRPSRWPSLQCQCAHTCDAETTSAGFLCERWYEATQDYLHWQLRGGGGGP